MFNGNLDKFEDVFNRLQIPVPRQDEYALTSDSGFLAPITDYGCILRGGKCFSDDLFEDSSYVISSTSFYSDYALQPLGIFDVGAFECKTTSRRGNYFVQIFPGMSNLLEKTIFDECDARNYVFVLQELKPFLKDKLEADGYYYIDHQWENAAYLPYKTEEFPLGVPTVIDMGCLSVVSEAAKKLENLSEDEIRARTPIQSMLYRNLQAAFKEAFEGVGGDAPNIFFDECQRSKALGILNSGWEHGSSHSNKIKNLCRYAQNYQKARDHHSGVVLECWEPAF